MAGGQDLIWPGAAATRLKDRGLTSLQWLGPEFCSSRPYLPI